MRRDWILQQGRGGGGICGGLVGKLGGGDEAWMIIVLFPFLLVKPPFVEE